LAVQQWLGWLTEGNHDVVAQMALFQMSLTIWNFFDCLLDDSDCQAVIEACYEGERLAVGKVTGLGGEWQRINHQFHHAGAERVFQTIWKDAHNRPVDQERFISVLLRAAETHKWPDDAVMNHMRHVILASFGPGWAALTASLYLLAKHPERQQWLREQISSVIRERPVVFADVDQLSAVHWVVKESLRLYPPLWVITREASETVVHADVEIPVGTMVFFSPYVSHRDPRYFENPLEFKPERFVSRISPWVYYPYGAAHHYCLGTDYMTKVLVLLLAATVQGWQFDLNESALDLAVEPYLTLVPSGPCWMRFRAL
jgi:cytochrome P450